MALRVFHLLVFNKNQKLNPLFLSCCFVHPPETIDHPSVFSRRERNQANRLRS